MVTSFIFLLLISNSFFSLSTAAHRHSQLSPPAPPRFTVSSRPLPKPRSAVPSPPRPTPRSNTISSSPPPPTHSTLSSSPPPPTPSSSNFSSSPPPPTRSTLSSSPPFLPLPPPHSTVSSPLAPPSLSTLSSPPQPEYSTLYYMVHSFLGKIVLGIFASGFAYLLFRACRWFLVEYVTLTAINNVFPI